MRSDLVLLHGLAKKTLAYNGTANSKEKICFCLGGSEFCIISTCLQWDQHPLELRTQVHLWRTVMMTNTTSMGKKPLRIPFSFKAGKYQLQLPLH